MRNPTYEQALDRQGVRWEYREAVPLDSIDAARSLRNQARLEAPIDEELVGAYARADKDGLALPPLVAWRPGRGRWVLIDGNQRLAAYRRNGRKEADAYAVESTDAKVIDRLTWTFNNSVNGRRLTAAEALEHAVAYARKYAVPAAEAAKEWGVHPGTLSNKVRQAELLDVLRRHDVRVTPTLADGALAALAPLQTVGEDLFVKAVGAVKDTGISAEDARDLARQVSRAATVAAKAKAIDDFAASPKVVERRAETKGGRTRTRPDAPRERFVRLVRELCNLVEDYPAEAVRPRPSDWKPTRERAADLVARLTLLFGLGAVPEAKEVS